MRTALWKLGFFDCYHMSTAQSLSETDGPQWARAFEAKYGDTGTYFTREDWDQLLGKYQATCDLPAALFSAELAEAYPEAKVVILNRDPEAWYDSVLNSIHKHVLNSSIWDKIVVGYRFAFDPGMWGLVQMLKWFPVVMPHEYARAKDKDKAIAWYKQQYDEFRERIPAERRIEYSVKDGWEPLCKHLGVPVPMVEDPETGKKVVAPFPHLSDRATFVGNVATIRSEGAQSAKNNMFRLLGKVTFTAATTGAIYWAVRTWLGDRV